ncbi:hypothetical protein [Lentzea terrae]|uniref:hypothetical protein n=1 Tax=Lentzea terrae TaxID=2200761 RepID=UPI000DD381BA|nr:hypothetical protein [Lentzea terrae]
MSTAKKNSIEKYAERALLAVEVTNETLAVFDDQPWSIPAQLALFTLKLIILMYLKSAADHEPQPEPDRRTSITDTVEIIELVDETDHEPTTSIDNTASTPDTDDSADQQQPDPQ